MSPSFSACPWRILKISSCLRSPLNPWTPRSLATVFSSVMVLSFNSDRFIFLPPSPPTADEVGAVSADESGSSRGGVLRLGLRCEMAISGGCHWERGKRRLNNSTRALSHRARNTVNGFLHHPRAASRRGSQAHVDDGALANLGEPLALADRQLLPQQDVADLVARLGEPIARERFLGIQAEEVVPDLRAERRRRLARREPENGGLDIRRQLAALERAQGAAVLAGAVLRQRLGELPEIGAAQHAIVGVGGAAARVLPAVLAPVGVGDEEDVARLEGEPRLELLTVLLDVAVDLLLGDGHPQVHAPAPDAIHHDLVADPLLDRLRG